MDFDNAKKYILDKLNDELPNNLYYHGVHHTLDVYRASIKLSNLEKLNEESSLIVQTAALYHDAGFLFRYENNEEIAVKLVKEVLPNYNYSSEQILAIAKIILTTKVAARPFTLLEKIMSDADYDYLGREDVKAIAQTLYEELLENGANFTEDEWNKLQIKFLKKHQFFTTSSKNLRQENKEKYINFLINL